MDFGLLNLWIFSKLKNQCSESEQKNTSAKKLQLAVKENCKENLEQSKRKSNKLFEKLFRSIFCLQAHYPKLSTHVQG